MFGKHTMIATERLPKRLFRRGLIYSPARKTMIATERLPGASLRSGRIYPTRKTGEERMPVVVFHSGRVVIEIAQPRFVNTPGSISIYLGKELEGAVESKVLIHRSESVGDQ